MSNASLQIMIDEERRAFHARIVEIALNYAGANDAKPATAARALPTVIPRFEEVGPVVVDHFTGLTWSHTLGDRVNHHDAEEAVAKLNKDRFAGHDDWRLPHVRELLGLVDYERHDPAIDTAAFPDTKSNWYWTATPYAGDAAFAWIVSFYDGYSYLGAGLRDHLVAFVRAVRGPAARPGQ